MNLSLGLVFLGAVVLHAGCFDLSSDCSVFLCPGGDSGPPPSCIPSENSGAVADSCGVFVSRTRGDATHGKGTQAAPYKTITVALTKGSTVYACAGTTSYSEALVVDKAMTLFGALDCGTWAYDAVKKTQLTAPADAVPLTLSSSASGTEIYDFAITAVGATAAGGSSIALWDNGADLDLTRCELTAGQGAVGAPGVTPAGSGQQGAAAPTPTPATALDGCGMNQTGVFGGSPGQSMCSTINTSGGLGGSGTDLATGGAGTDAQPQPQPNAMSGFDGKAGKAEDTTPCLPGDNGANGLPGTMPGTGATGLGDLGSTGYQAPTATPGQSAGGPGYGGGGGGGAEKCANGFAGPAGGGGGAGGCGGQPGGAGQSAGSSFALVSLSATVTLSTVTLTAANGGTGGVGGNGQPGGSGGNGGLAGSSGSDTTVKACNGGNGGQGGRGSSGGGGLGGHSSGIAFKGTAPTQMNVTINHGTGGPGGIGGDMDMTSPGIVGGDGLACTTLDFTNPTSPTACSM
jgi:hypothetical protein